MFQMKNLTPRDVTFSNDGKKMFIVGNNGDDVDEYTLSTAYNVSTAVFVDSFSVASEDGINHLELGLTMMDQKCLLQEEQIEKYLNILSL